MGERTITHERQVPVHVPVVQDGDVAVAVPRPMPVPSPIPYEVRTKSYCEECVLGG